MKRTRDRLPTIVTALLITAALIHGPVAQLPYYHDFADQMTRFGIPHFADVVSNLGFLAVALWGMATLSRFREHPALASGWGGYRLFLAGLFLTAFGSAYYHLAPDNLSLVWDRLPITLACGGLLAGVWGDRHGRGSRDFAAVLALVGVASVAWWHFTEQAGAGDLRPYLALQILPFLLIPIWQASYDAGKADRWYFGLALITYAAAKWAEIDDHEIAAVLGVSGHTLKHLLAALSSLLIVTGLNCRVATREVPGTPAAVLAQ